MSDFAMNLNDEFKLKVFKSRQVKTPTKSYDAAGWDFYIPEDLSIFDFTKNCKMFLDDSIDYQEKNYQIPLIFHLKSQKTFGGNFNEYACKLVLINDKNEGWTFNFLDANSLILINEDSNIYKWMQDKDTVIEKITLLPHGSINIPSGIHVNLPSNVFLKAENKSGVGSKRRLSFLASVIDVDYVGEIHINLINESDLKVNIKAGEKIVQFIPMFQPNMKNVEEYSSLEELCKDKQTDRGSDGFGSTDNSKK